MATEGGLVTDKDDADAAHRADLRAALLEAAGRLNVRVAGAEVYGWRDRSVGAPVTSDSGQSWLRVVRELPEWTGGQFWTGNEDAAVLPDDVRRPRVIASDEWDDGTLSCRAELLTLVGATRCSSTPELRTGPPLTSEWWASLRESLDALAGAPTERVTTDSADIAATLAVYFGIEVDLSFLVWSTAHGDLQWTNLTLPDCWLLDWEAWGRAPLGLDAATLLCHSLLVPGTADAVQGAFADLLDTPTGRVAQLYAAGHMLRRIVDGDYPDLAIPLHRHARQVQGRHRLRPEDMIIEGVAARAYPDDEEPNPNEWPFTLAPVAQLLRDGLRFDQPVTFLVGENGSGKSTIVEAIAEAYGVDPRGGHIGRQYASSEPQSSLGQAIRLRRTSIGRSMVGTKPRGYFLRAETSYGFFEYVTGTPAYGGHDLLRLSHGESFLAVFDTRFDRQGLYLLDEPESALSFTSCLRLLALLGDIAERGSQVICATHSPLLAALPGAQILEIGDFGIREATWNDLQLVDHWRRFLSRPDAYLRHLAED